MAVKDAPAQELITKVAAELKKEGTVKAPEWSMYAKTGSHKERQPQNDDWWHIRAAAILRTVSIRGPIGVSKLRTKYGGRKRRGHKTEHFRKGSGSVARKILQQLEAAGLVAHAKKGAHHGRITTGKAQSLLDNVSRHGRTQPVKRKEAAGTQGKRAEAAATPAAGRERQAAPDKESA